MITAKTEAYSTKHNQHSNKIIIQITRGRSLSRTIVAFSSDVDNCAANSCWRRQSDIQCKGAKSLYINKFKKFPNNSTCAMSPEQICRTCLGSTGTLHNLFGPDRIQLERDKASAADFIGLLLNTAVTKICCFSLA